MTPAYRQLGLKDAWSHCFQVGAVVSSRLLANKDVASILQRHFASITTEDAVGLAKVQPNEGEWNWEDADAITNFARKNSMSVRGHPLISHKQAPEWLFPVDSGTVSKTRLYDRLEHYLHAVMTRYGNIIDTWDVLAEIIESEPDGIDNLGRSPWLDSGGESLYTFALKTAHEAAPDAKLYLTDYGIETPVKRLRAVRVLSDFLDAGLPVNGIGIQGHWTYDYPNEDMLRQTIETFANLHMDIALSEIDISVYSASETLEVFDTLPEERASLQTKCFTQVFQIASEYPAVKSVTTWGVCDDQSRREESRQRENWPLLFDARHHAKSVVPMLIDIGLALAD